jgi:hypothetical protein
MGIPVTRNGLMLKYGLVGFGLITKKPYPPGCGFFVGGSRRTGASLAFFA